jgi:carboxyl-terminal processing protease
MYFMNGLAILTVLVAAGAPVPEPPKVRPTVSVDRYQAENFARLVDMVAIEVKRKSAMEGLTEKELIAGAIQGLYEEIGLPVPDSIKEEVQQAKSAFALMDALANARIQLGNHPKLAGTRSLFAAMNGFRHATDSLSILISQRTNPNVTIEQDFGIGIELEGVSGTRWTIYQTEYGIASGRFAPVGYFGPVPRPDAVPSPAVLPWKVKSVVPGSPAQKGGVKPGDQITHLDGVEINADNANKLFAMFAIPRAAIFDPQTGRALSEDRIVVFRRNNGKPFEVALRNSIYNPESAFGVLRLKDEKWDCMLDRRAKIGYVRLGPIEQGVDEVIDTMIADLVAQECRGLILDLRWCPGGYVDPGLRTAGLFLKDGSVVAKMQYRDYQSGNSGDLLTPPGGGKYIDLPLVVLVGQETTGGGELIAAALRDNNRCVIVGQRSVGRAAIQNTIEAGFGGLQFKLTIGTSLRPNGKNRQRKPDSLPTGDWGIRPDEGLEVPVTLDKSMELHREADLQALRPLGDYQVLPFDDPNLDPYRLTALYYLRKKLASEKIHPLPDDRGSQKKTPD